MDLFGDLPPPSDSVLGKRKEDGVQEDNGVRESKQAKISISCFKFKGYLGERRGEREDMQDAHTIIDDFTSGFETLPNDISSVAYYGVFDGHGGPQASAFAAEHLHKNIALKFPKGKVQNLERELRKCLLDSFKKTDEDFLHKASLATPTWKDGSTVAAILVLDDVLYSGYLGDSRAVLCRRSAEGKVALVHLTKDHNPSNFDERKRIEKSGGTVREGRVMGIVEVSRSIGDGRFKHCGIISTPDILRCQLTERDMFILVACDGLWKVFTAEEACKFIISVLEDDQIQIKEDGPVSTTNFESGRPATVKDLRYEEACNRLAVEAVKKGCTDNVTVMIVDITHTSSRNDHC